MRLAIACGGTGGHIFPGLAVAETMQRRGHEVTLWLAGKDIEGEALSGWEGQVVTVPSQGFQGNIFNHLKTFLRMTKVVGECRSKMENDTPEVLLAMGSYASIGPGIASHRLKIPLVLHEANVIPGRAVNFLSRYADRVAISFEETCYHLKRKGADVTGMPLRSDLQAKAEENSNGHRSGEKFRLLIMGGSRGAHRLNEICSQAICSMNSGPRDISVIHLTGGADEEMVKGSYEAAGIEHCVYAFHHDMANVYRNADMAICRAGASTCAELNAFALPALLVPYPFAVKHHQTENARAMERRGCADVIEESNLSRAWLAAYIEENRQESERLERMRRAARRNQLHMGAKALADLLEEVHASAGSDRIESAR